MRRAGFAAGCSGSDHVLMTPTYIHGLIAAEIVMQIMSAVEQLWAERDDAPFEVIQALVARQHEQHLRHATEALMLTGLSAAQQAVEQSSPGYRSLSDVPGIWSYDKALMIDAHLITVEQFSAPRYERDPEQRLTHYDVPEWAFLTAVFWIDPTPMSDRASQVDSRLVLSKVAADLRAYRMDHGAYPTSLEAIYDTIPTDAWGGHPIVYQASDDGLMVSVQGETSEDWAQWRW